ncbi:pseudouridine-5'-phosphate glycosidase [Pseudothermotoga sp. U03pept]|uniref:pseudouridine-5'-phosphate glycosidase n=1 Tax=Pseudothermotoga sp. U03pept TaxID=3447012 RepID=UPI003F0C7608
MKDGDMVFNRTVALESTVIAHGLPKPKNVETAMELEAVVRRHDCTPKTIAIVAGEVRIGLSSEEIQEIGTREDVMKVGVSEIPVAVALKRWAATTVSATVRLAYLSGIKVFATGGIGGVHSTKDWDVSQDLIELSRTRMIVVCAGPKSILDLRSTVEMLETFQVTAVGYRTDRLPAFYCRSTSIPITKVESVEEIVSIFLSKESFDLPGSVLVFNPIPERYEIDEVEFKKWHQLAEKDLEWSNVKGKDLTPFLLSRLAHYSDGRTVESNIELLKNNVNLACQIVDQLSKMQ